MNETTDKASADSKVPFWRSRSGIALLVLLGSAAFLLYFEHRAHIPGDVWLLGGLVALCLFMHKFMHGSHGGQHHEHRDHNEPPDSERN